MICDNCIIYIFIHHNYGSTEKKQMYIKRLKNESITQQTYN